MSPVALRRRALDNSAHPRPDSELFFSRPWTDPDVEAALLERLEASSETPLRVATVAGSGLGALGLLRSPRIERVDAIDLSAAQLHLTELQRRALEHLPHDAQLALLGYAEATGEERDALYQRLRFSLPEATRAFWDARGEELRYGLARVGRLEALLDELATQLQELGLDPVARPSEALGHLGWVRTFEAVFDRAQLAVRFGASAVSYSTERSFASHFSARFADALRKSRAVRNPFLAQLFCLPLVDEDLPWSLREDAQGAIREGGLDRLHLHAGPFLGRLLSLHEKGTVYDLVDLADLLDWLPTTERHVVLRRAREALRPGGMLVARRWNGDGSLAQLVKSHLDVDTALSAALTDAERSLVYRDVVVAYRRA